MRIQNPYLPLLKRSLLLQILYPPKAIREALINAIIHADYSLKSSTTQVAIFSNRIEITNLGTLTYGQTMELALSGISRMRNRIINIINRL